MMYFIDILGGGMKKMYRAYSDMYLYDVMRNLAGFFDIAVNDLNMDADEIASLFSSSNIASGIEKGNPLYLSGKSSTEMLEELLEKEVEFTVIPMERSEEYWAGWILAYAQWYLDRPFKDILETISFSRIVSLYNPYHEADEMKTVELIENMMYPVPQLKKLRKLSGLSQKQLSDLSGVKLRTIQAYEQGELDIFKAEGSTLYALAKTLGCSMEELIRK